MKRTTLALIIAILAAAGLHAFDGYVDVTNDTGYTITYLYVSHETLDSWGDDMLGDNVLMNGDTYRVYLSGQPSSIFDIMMEDEDGDTYTFYGVDVETEDIIVTLDDLDGSAGGSAGETTISGPGGDFDGWVEVFNDTGFTMYYLYIRQDAKSWGPDLLGDNVLADGDSFTVNVMNYPGSIFDIRLEDEEGDSYTFRDVDIEVDDVYITLDNLDG